MSIPDWQWFRTIDIASGAANDPDWSDAPETYDIEDVEDIILIVPMDIGNSRDVGLKQLSIYGICTTSAGVPVNRGSFTYDLTPVEVAKPGPSGTNDSIAHPIALVEGTTTTSEPNDKSTLNIGPVVCRLVIRVSNMLNVPASADDLRLYWRPGA